MLDELADAFSESPDQNENSEAESEKVEKDAETTSEPEQKETEAEPKEDAKESEETENISDKEKAYLAQAKDERQKRQDRDKEIERLKAELEGFKNPKEPEERPDVLEDQDGYTKSLENTLQSQIAQAKLDIGREMMVSFHDDYEQVETFVLEKMKDNPALKAELQQASNIPKAVYETGKKMMQFEEIKGFNSEEYKAKLKAELLAEMKAESEQKKSEDDYKPKLTPSLANARGSTIADEKEVTDLSDLF